jgi:type II restriction enzyme
MANWRRLRKVKKGNLSKWSVKSESSIHKAVENVLEVLRRVYPKEAFAHESKLKLKELVDILKQSSPKYGKRFSLTLETSFIKPDGGFIYLLDNKKKKKIILVAEVKRQGTNDTRRNEGLPQQAQGNAVERLGKNLIGIRAIFKKEKIIPFICFGNGWDFKKGSSILDRVVTMNDFFPLNRFFIKKEHPPYDPVSMFFRYKEWSVDEMTEKMLKVARTAMDYYLS